MPQTSMILNIKNERGKKKQKIFPHKAKVHPVWIKFISFNSAARINFYVITFFKKKLISAEEFFIWMI